jgi:hypothetical protein
MSGKFLSSWTARLPRAAEFGIRALRLAIGKKWFVPVLTVLSLVALARTAGNSAGRFLAESDLARHPKKAATQPESQNTGSAIEPPKTDLSKPQGQSAGAGLPANPVKGSSSSLKTPTYIRGISAVPRNVPPSIANIRVGLPILILILVWVVERVSQEKPTSVEDKPDFKNALTIWGPVLGTIYKSPRQMKRFLNWLRYLALLENPETEQKAAVQTTKIQEHLLVALAVIQKIDRDLVTLTGVRLKGDDGIRAAWVEHTRKFQTTQTDAAVYRDRFLKLASGAIARYS